MAIDYQTLAKDINKLVEDVNNLSAINYEDRNEYLTYDKLFKRVANNLGPIKNIVIDTLRLNGQLNVGSLRFGNDRVINSSNNNEYVFGNHITEGDSNYKTVKDLGLKPFKNCDDTKLIKDTEYYIVIEKDGIKYPVSIMYNGININTPLYKVNDNVLTSDYVFTLKKRG